MSVEVSALQQHTGLSLLIWWYVTGLVVLGPKALDTGNNDKGSGGIGEKSIRSGDEVFLDAVTDFWDGGLSLVVKEPLRDNLDSATD